LLGQKFFGGNEKEFFLVQKGMDLAEGLKMRKKYLSGFVQPENISWLAQPRVG